MNWSAEDKVKVEGVLYAMLGMQRGILLNTASWEQGVAAQALLELDVAGISASHFVRALVHDAVVRQASDGRFAVRLNGGDPGALDPASLVEPTLFIAKRDEEDHLQNAARKQINYLVDTPAIRTASGLISHRMDKMQLWADGLYMGPPALTAAAKYLNNSVLYTDAFKQIQGYRSILWNPEHKLFSHIYDVPTQTFERAAFWGVGNGWALAGMTLVWLLLPSNMDEERGILLQWILDCLDGVLCHQRSDGLFHDVLDDPSTFVETNVGQQVAYTTFQLSQHETLGDHAASYLRKAEAIRAAVRRKVDKFGLVEGACGSPDFKGPGTATEAQAFYILMEAECHDMLMSHSE